MLALLCALVLPTNAYAQQPSATVQAESEAFDAKILAELAALEPDARESWIAANEARETGDFAQALERYTEVLDVHPEFHHALRRRCSVRSAMERWASALEDCQAAYDLEPSRENKGSLALVLAGAPAGVGDPTRARKLADQVLTQAKDDFTSVMVVCQVAVTLEDAKLAKRCASTLRTLDAKAWEAQFYSSFAHALNGDIDEAREALDRAHAVGLDDEVYEDVDAMLVQAQSPLVYYGKKAGWVVLLWIGVAAALVGAGFALSRLTLAEAEGALKDPRASARSHDSWLHKAYAWVLWLSSTSGTDR